MHFIGWHFFSVLCDDDLDALFSSWEIDGQKLSTH